MDGQLIALIIGVVLLIGGAIGSEYSTIRKIWRGEPIITPVRRPRIRTITRRHTKKRRA